VETLQMEEFKPSETEEQQYLHIIEEETERLTYLIHDLLEIARMDAGTLSIEPHSIDCREFLTDFTGRNELQLKKRGISLTWNARPGQTIFADHRRLEQIFQNLLDNTMKHSTGAAGILIEVTDESAQTVITFSDNGTGIPTSQLNRIFDRYYSTTPEIPVQGVSGLGLAIVKGLIELHHGIITVSSSKQGTSFCIRLPQ
jgi:signal transduction histidine kinase